MSKYWIQTYSTNKFDFEDIKQESISLICIANALAQIPRFNGHLKRPYSVAQHSLTTAAVLRKDGESKKVALQGLMHDAHEAYVGDMSRPFKLWLKEVHNVPIGKIILPIKKAISKRFDIDIVDYPSIIDDVDDACCRTEAETLFERPVDNWTKNIPTVLKDKPKKILGVKDAKDLFISTFKRLGGEV